MAVELIHATEEPPMMKRRQFLQTLLTGGMATGIPATLRAAVFPRAQRPNLLFVFPDQWRGQALGFLGEEPVLTPHLDRFATQSLVLTHAVSTYPVCSPYRAMLMSGKYPVGNGVLTNCTSEETRMGNELKADERCWSDVLKAQGYCLGYIGKWHLDAPQTPWVPTSNNQGPVKWNEWCPPERRHGFDYWYAYGTYDMHLHPKYWTEGTPRMTPLTIDQWGPQHEADLAISYLKNEHSQRDPARPFALVVAMNPPHMPYSQVPPRYVERYAGKTPEQLCTRKNVDLTQDTPGARLARNQIKNYFAMMTGVDEQFGRILAVLKEQKLEDNTIVVFTSDHGNCLGCHEEIAKNVHYEESMRVPFLIRWPGRIAPRRDDLLMDTPDICPTLLDLMGLAGEIPAGVQGVSRAGVFRTGQGSRPTSQLYYYSEKGKPASGRRGLRNHRYMFMIARREDDSESITLHDNVEDPFQLVNAAARQPGVVGELRQEMETRLKALGDPWVTRPS
jgi:arylsulfatase A-like enzyme